MEKAVILLSGGLDSATCLAIAQSRQFKCHTLSFNYGQKQVAELAAAEATSKRMQAAEHHVVELNIGQFGGSALTDQNIEVPNFSNTQAIPVTYVPARNTIFLSIALGLAETINANHIFIGSSQIDYSGYPDCRSEYFNAFNQLIALATKKTVEGGTIHIETPLINLSKADTIRLGLSLGVDYGQTITCYQANDIGEACGTCESCVLRKKGFAEAGVADPTRYITK